MNNGPKSTDCIIDGMQFTFRALFATIGQKDGQKEICSTDMQEMHVDDNGSIKTVVWKGNAFAGKDFTVKAVIHTNADGLREWTAEISGASCDETPVQFDFPCVTRSFTQDTQVVDLQSQGEMARPASPLLKPGYQILFSTMRMGRCAAFIEPGDTSWYFDLPRTDSTDAVYFFTKTDSDKVSLTFRNFFEVISKGGKVSFAGAFKPFKGSWFEMAQIYKTRPFVQDMIRRAKARGNPKALRDISMWMWNRGPKDNVLPPVLKFQEDSGLPAALDWYWWHSIPYDSGYPNFWPPRDGVENFRAAVKEATDAGVFIQVYINGLAWDMDDPTFKTDGGEDEVIRHLDGTYTGIAFNRYDGHRLSYICGNQPKFKARHLELLKNLHDSGLSGQYLDQLGCCLYEPCYALNHGHKQGASPLPAYRKQLAEYRRTFPNWPLCTEDTTECLLDLFDTLICLLPSVERLGWAAEYTESIPFWSAVYHGCATVFGNYDMIDHIPPFDPKWPDKDRWKEEKEWEKLFPDQFAVELARGVIWGMQPSVHNFQLKHTSDPRFAADYKFMVDTAKFYHANRDFLYDGEMLSPGTMECERRNVKFTRRMIYTKDGEYREVSRELPAVFHSCWKSPDGTSAAILVNWTREPQHIKLTTPDFGTIDLVIPARGWKLVNG